MKNNNIIMNEDNLFEMRPNTILGLMPIRQIKFNGEYSRVAKLQQLKKNRYNILLENGKVIPEVNFDIDLDYHMPSLVMGRSNLVYLKDQNGNYTNQDPKSKQLRDACAQIEDLNTQVKQLKMNISRLTDEKKESSYVDDLTSQLGKSRTNMMGGREDRYERSMIRQQFPTQYDEAEEQARDNETQREEVE